ncbi:MFS transporter, partial [Pseudomonas aeruginosa]|uniref:MFS transporter n=1 Tax=Pseudomonas aeruginosa TaxID=287 RepID=UPI0015CA2BF8
MLALLACAQLIIALDATIVFVALPEISRALDFSAQRLQWVVSAYTVAFGGFLLLGGRATDLLGRRRMYVLGQSLYALASLAGGLAQSELPLILARAVQGLGGALLFPATLALIGNHFAEGPARNRALAIWSIASAFGLALGEVIADQRQGRREQQRATQALHGAGEDQRQLALGQAAREGREGVQALPE